MTTFSCNLFIEEFINNQQISFLLDKDGNCGSCHQPIGSHKRSNLQPEGQGIPEKILSALDEVNSKLNAGFIEISEVNSKLNAGFIEIRADLKRAESRRLTKELNCWRTNLRTQVECTDFKRGVITYYKRAATFNLNKIVTARCMVTDGTFRYDELRPAHLVKHCKPELMILYGLNQDNIDDPRNRILMLDSIEKAFDHLDVCFLYNGIDQIITLKVLNPTLNQLQINPTSSTDLRTFAEINGSILQHPNGRYPYRRILSMHAKFAYARALSRNWITTNTEVLSTYFQVSDGGLDEPECIRDFTWETLDYASIENIL